VSPGRPLAEGGVLRPGVSGSDARGAQGLGGVEEGVAIDWAGELRKALALQELDRQADALRDERRTLLADAEGARLERQVRSCEAEIQGIQAELAETERRQRLQELERQSLEAERDRNAQRLYGGAVRSPRDVEGLQKNIDGANARIGDLETSILEAMERTDLLRKQLVDARQRLAAARSALQSRSQAVRQRVARIDQLLPGLQLRREPLVRAIAPAVLHEYDRVRSRAGGIAVAAVRDGACGACGLAVPPRQLELLRQGDQPVSCEHCARLLVNAPGHEGAPAGDRSGLPPPGTGAGR
jgi:predicted  nucleic acid-binding Zn-ribbon protein